MAGEIINRDNFNAKKIPALQGPILNGTVWQHEFTTGQLELADVLNLGYLPAGCTLLGFLVYIDDIDSATTLVWKLSVGGTDVSTGNTDGRTAGGAIKVIEPRTLTATDLVTFTVTTAPTAVAGTLYVIPLYIPN